MRRRALVFGLALFLWSCGTSSSGSSRDDDDGSGDAAFLDASNDVAPDGGDDVLDAGEDASVDPSIDMGDTMVVDVGQDATGDIERDPDATEDPDVQDADAEDADVPDAEDADDADADTDADAHDVDARDADAEDVDDPDADDADAEDSPDSDLDAADAEDTNDTGPSVAGAGEICDPGGVCGDAIPCDDGLACIGTGDVSLCLTVCTVGSPTACSSNPELSCLDTGDGRGACFPADLSCETDGDCLFGGFLEGYTCVEQEGGSFCRAAHTLQTVVGDSCGTIATGSCEVEICDFSAGLRCGADGTCAAGLEVGEGAPCDPDGDFFPEIRFCAEGLACVAYGAGAPWGICNEQCEAGVDSCTNGDLTCEPILSGGGGLCVDSGCADDSDCDLPAHTCNTGSGLCFPVEPAISAVGEYCGSVDYWNRVIACEEGTQCVNYSSAGWGACEVRCTTADECAMGEVCPLIVSDGGGICAQGCAGGMCSAGTTCQQVDAGTSICFPDAPAGDVPFGGVCDDSLNGTCADGLFCLRAAETTDGYCTRNCTVDGMCPATGDGIPSACTQIDSMGNRACLFPCDQPGQMCPAGLSCQNIGPQVCLAPPSP